MMYSLLRFRWIIGISGRELYIGIVKKGVSTKEECCDEMHLRD